MCLADATVFVILVPPPKDAPATNTAVGIQLGEYLESCRSTKSRPPHVVCLHHPDVTVDELIGLYDSNVLTVVRGEATAVSAWIKRLNPDISDAILQTATTALLAAVEAEIPLQRYTTAPTVTVTIIDTDMTKLSTGEMPLDATIGGDRWEEIFGIERGQAGMAWRDLRDKLANLPQWEPILAEELLSVSREPHWQQNAVPILLDESSNIPPVAAVVQKYEVFAGNVLAGQTQLPRVHRFSLVVFRAPQLYSPEDLRPIATAFHLLVIAQSYRFMVLEKDLEDLKIARGPLEYRDRIPDASKKAALAIAVLRRHLLLFDVESRRRNFFNRLSALDHLVIDSLPAGANDSEKQAAEAKQKRLSDIFKTDWDPIRTRLDKAIHDGVERLADIIARLEDTKKLNAEVLTIAAECYLALLREGY